jgi:hypothetical protein
MVTEQQMQDAVAALREHGSQSAAALALGIARSTLQNQLKRAGEAGIAGYEPVIPGFRVSQVSTAHDESGAIVRKFIQQKPERGGAFEVPDGQKIKGVSALVNEDGREIIKWIKTDEDKQRAESIRKAALEALLDQVPRVDASPRQWRIPHADLLCQYTLTDVHLGMLAWGEETGAGDYDLSIAEQLLESWFDAAIDMAPDAHTGVLAQLGDLLHHDSHESVTPAHRHVLDADSRFQKMVRVAVRVIRKIVAKLLFKHERVVIIMADANHDPASEAWLREMLAAFYENEPRVEVLSSAGTYYAIPWGDVSLFYHHGHKRGIANVDTVFAGKFRSLYGATKYSYAHIGHLHSDELKNTNLMKVERHETLASPDAYAALGGWLTNQSAKVIHYHKRFGEVGRNTITPAMLSGEALDKLQALIAAYGR